MSTAEAPEKTQEKLPSLFDHCQDPSEFIFVAAQNSLAGNRAAMLVAAAASRAVPKFMRSETAKGQQFMRDVFLPFERADCLGDNLAKLLDVTNPKAASEDEAKLLNMAIDVIVGVAISVANGLTSQDEFNALVKKNDPKTWMDKFVDVGEESGKLILDKLGASELPPEIKKLLKTLFGDVTKAFREHGHDSDATDGGPNKGVTSIRRGPKPGDFPS